MKYLLPILIILLTSCNPLKQYARQKKRAERKIEALTIKFPELKQKDTIVIQDTLITKQIKHDTTFLETLNDTIVINKEKLTVRYVKIGDTVYLSGECASDTVVNEVRVPVDRILIKSQYPEWVLWFMRFRPLIFIIGLFVLAVWISKKFVN